MRSRNGDQDGDRSSARRIPSKSLLMMSGILGIARIRWISWIWGIRIAVRLA